MANVYDLANELERAVRALPEYQAVLTAKAAIENDADAQVLWQDFLATQSKVQEMMQSGQMPSQEEQDEMSKLGEKIESNDLLKVYFDQQQRLSVYMSDLCYLHSEHPNCCAFTLLHYPIKMYFYTFFESGYLFLDLVMSLNTPS